MLEEAAKLIFQAAIDESRCEELLLALFDGGSATVDDDGKLVIASAKQLDDLVGRASSAGLTTATTSYTSGDQIGTEVKGKREQQ